MRLAKHRGKFCAVWYENGRRIRRSLGTDDLTAAKRRLAELDRARQRLREHSVADLYKAYAAAKGRARIRDAWKALAPTFGPLGPAQITEGLCRAYAQEREARGISTGTIHTELLYLAAALNRAERLGLIEKAPHVWKPQKPRPRDRRLSREEARALVDAAHMPHVRLALILMLGTAARVGAVLDLTWNRVDFDRGLIHLDNPERAETTKRRATVPMNATVRAALEAARAGALTDHVIEWGGKPVRSIKRGFRAACRRAGLEGVTPHTLRHTAATWMAEAGVPMDEIAQFLGHSDARTTYRVYARYSPDYLRKAGRALEL
ncbi:MAG: site-specific integrase [Alphaproteobacteria bacterium]|nr:MAG: site-specific integrase [Alphaproteobacteria bacterium]